MRARDSVLVLFGGLGCSSPTIDEIQGDGGCAELQREHDDDDELRCATKSVRLTDSRAIDLLFVIDDGPEAGALQMRLADAMDDLAAGLVGMDPPPELRIAFTSSRDANPGCGGGTGFVELSSCRERPEDFVAPDGTDRFAELCEARCEIDELATSQGWIESASEVTNLATGTALADALRCASLLGVSGCPFPAPMNATQSALLRSEQDIEAGEDGFFRRDATPIVVWVTSGAECSLGPAGLAAFDASGARELWSDPELATVGLCWNSGVECSAPDDTGAMTCAAANIDALGRETGPDDAVLADVDKLANVLEEVADVRRDYDPFANVRVLAITGVPADGIPGSPPAFAPADDVTAARYGVEPTCTLDGDAMLPPIRLAAFRELAEAHRFADPTLLSACTDDFAPALAYVATAIEESIRPSCMPACVADVDEHTDGLQIACNLIVSTRRADGGFDESLLVPCEGSPGGDPIIPAGEPGCHAPRVGLAMHPSCIAEGWNVEFDLVWNGFKPPATTFSATCELSQDRARDCPAL